MFGVLSRFMVAIFLLLAMVACGGGGSSTKAVAVSGVVAFPAATGTAKRVALDATSPKIEIYSLSGALITTATLTLQDNGTYKYQAEVPAGQDYLLKAVKDAMVLRALLPKAEVAGAQASRDVDSVTTTAVIVVEKALALTPGALGGSADATQVQEVSIAIAQALANIEGNISTALTTCQGSGTVTEAQAQLANLANTVKAAVSNLLDPAAFMAGTTSTTSIPVVTYTVSGGSVTTTNATVTADSANQMSTATIDALPNITSNNSVDFSIGTTGSFTVSGTGTFSVSGALPSGVTFNAQSGVLSGTPAAGSAGSYTLTIAATASGLTATQTFTLTVKPAASTTATGAKAALQAGMYWIDYGTYWNGTAEVPYYAIETVKLAADGTSFEGGYTYYNNGAWSATPPADMPSDYYGYQSDYRLTATGWKLGTDGPQDYTASFNSDGSATLTNKIDGSKSKMVISSSDISGQPLSSVEYAMLFANSNLTFPSGSFKYYDTWTSLSDQYTMYSSMGPGITTLADVPTYVNWIYIGSADYNDYYYYGKFASAGVVEIYRGVLNTTSSEVMIGHGSYSNITVSGMQMLEVAIPEPLRTQYHLGANRIYGVINGEMWEGEHTVIGPNYDNGGYMWNSVVVDFFKSHMPVAKRTAKKTARNAVNKVVHGSFFR